MPLLDDLEHKRRNKTCTFAKTLAKLTDKEQARIAEIGASIVADEGEYSASWLAKQLTANGHPANHQAVMRHIRNECCCAG
jgi:hypothetical protein